MRWTEEQYEEYLKNRGKKVEKPKPKKQKYKNKGTWIDGVFFRSQLEAKRYCQLKLLFHAGEIAGFVLQPQFILQEGNRENRAITYSADFLVLNKDKTYTVEDTKGYESEQWKRTYKQFKLRYPNIELKILKEV
ncbi:MULTISPECIES: DUF1064 domain-containing protein [Clostridium]|uniref:DUF1064 domain-containing protein n=1 Tax=Clostridium tepidum TaxID=1962263 RepID=A0ABX3L353_9CLOT|nr:MULTISPECIES: DUF1064 domain-containing protein [Clostridium]MCW6079026.1 DUF1064 domain-containing protein [Clostridium sporogenes]OOO61995.1 hypothetical protein BS637_09335 [Clostridium tepidum]